MAQHTFGSKLPSGNAKLTGKHRNVPIFSTYRTVGLTCPSECTLQDNGCYAQSGRVAMHQKAAQVRELDVADYVRYLPKDAMVRHLVSGDLFKGNEPDQEYIDEMVAGHEARPDVKGWAYTHGWQRLDPGDVNRDNLVVNASSESHEETVAAMIAGWDVAMVLPHDAPKSINKDEYLVITCPAQTAGKTCAECQLCARPNRHTRDGKVIVVGFRAHAGHKKVEAQLAKKGQNNEGNI